MSNIYPDIYPHDWPRCPKCDQPALDGHITCGDVRCNESAERDKRQRLNLGANLGADGPDKERGAI